MSRKNDRPTVSQKLTYTCKDNVYNGSFQFQWFLQLSFFCDGMCGTLGSVWFNTEFIIALLKIWLNLLGKKKYTYSDSDVWLNASWPFSPVLLLDFSHSPILGGKVPSILKTCGCSLWSSNTFLFHLTTFHLEFSSRRFFSLSMWPAANFSRALMCHIWSNSIVLAGCWCKIHLTEDTDSCLPAASNSFHFGCF